MTETFKTDVLVIGGGMAGLLTAIKARQQQVEVILVDKAYAGKSGQSPYADSLCPFNRKWGHNLEKWLHAVNVSGEYINNPEWTKLVLENSFAIYKLFKSWNIEFHKNPDGSLFKKEMPDGGGSTVFFHKNQAPQAARKEALKLGVRIFDRLMITELITSDSKVIGAAGITAENADLRIFNSKVTVMCAGAAGFKPNGWPIHELSGDSDALAYRIGAEVLGKEFTDTHMGNRKTPAFIPFAEQMKAGAGPNTGPKFRRILNAEGDPPHFKGTGGLWLSNEFEIHAGRGPLSAEMPDGSMMEFAGGTTLGLASHKTEGIVPSGLTCATTVDGLFAAGDALGNMAAGAKYPFMGFAITHACVTGCMAGKNAADYAAASPRNTITTEEINAVRQRTFKPLNRKGGFSPRWVIDVLKNALSPYFILYIKHEDRLRGALTYINFIRSHLLSKLIASDAHELRLAHEACNIVLNAEIKLRSSLARKESRGCHYREDFPYRDDKNFLGWIKLKDIDGKMTTLFEPVPEKYRPDLSIPYERRYTARIPGELDHFKRTL
ncbi:FAD-binding protein [Lentisphaerota bacterium ZTH]|nr:FAD-binding protein [Lentisphaerota bacterium]WET07305.1 FAD-binding protein [Lentisphaerota bacterium ZTH]